MKVLFVTPTEREKRAINREALVCGSGEEAAVRLRERMAGAKLDLVLIAGYCGGLDPSLPQGRLILGRSVIAPKQEEITPPRLLLEAVQKGFRDRNLTFVTSRLLTVDRPAATKNDKTRLWNVFGAGGVDMETYQLAQVAREFDVPWLALRAVIDPAGQALPRSLRDWRREQDQGGILRKAALRPTEWPRYARLAAAVRPADRALRAGIVLALAAAEKAPIEELPLI